MQFAKRKRQCIRTSQTQFAKAKRNTIRKAETQCIRKNQTQFANRNATQFANRSQCSSQNSDAIRESETQRNSINRNAMQFALSQLCLRWTQVLCDHCNIDLSRSRYVIDELRADYCSTGHHPNPTVRSVPHPVLAKLVQRSIYRGQSTITCGNSNGDRLMMRMLLTNQPCPIISTQTTKDWIFRE